MNTNETVAVFYHNKDNDGILSGVIAEYYLQARCQTVDLIPINYGDDFEKALPLSASLYDSIYIIDVSDEKFMQKYGEKIIYIDHHKWAMDTMPKVKDRHCIDGVAACRLTFDYLASGPNYVFHTKEYFKERLNPMEPLVVAIIGEFDIWDKSSILAERLNYGQEVNFAKMKYLFKETKGILVEDSPIKTCDNLALEINSTKIKPGRDWGYLKYIVDKGEGALAYVQNSVDNITPEEFKCGEMNGVYFNTAIDASLVSMCYRLKEGQDFLMVWSLSSKGVKASFRSSKVDVSEIARKFKGGGHKAAASCKMKLHELLEFIGAVTV